MLLPSAVTVVVVVCWCRPVSMTSTVWAEPYLLRNLAFAISKTSIYYADLLLRIITICNLFLLQNACQNNRRKQIIKWNAFHSQSPIHSKYATQFLLLIKVLCYVLFVCWRHLIVAMCRRAFPHSARAPAMFWIIRFAYFVVFATCE